MEGICCQQIYEVSKLNKQLRKINLFERSHMLEKWWGREMVYITLEIHLQEKTFSMQENKAN